MLRFAPYRSTATRRDAPAGVHQNGDIVVHLHAPLGPATVRLAPETADVRYEARLREMSVPLFLASFLCAASEAGALMLMSRRIRGLPDGALYVLWIPAVIFVVAAVGLFDPRARRVHIRGSTRGGQRVATTLAFATAGDAKSFVLAVQEAARRETTPFP